MPSPTPPIGVFDYRQTSLVFKDYLPSVVQSWLSVNREAEQMCHGSGGEVNNCAILPHIGWTLRSYHHKPGEAATLTAAQPGIVSAASLAPNTGTVNTFMKVTGVTGLTYATGVQASGSPYYQVQPPAGNDWSTNALAADQAAMPSPFPSEDTTTLDRVYVAPAGAVDPWDNVTFSVYAPGAAVTPKATIANFYFDGPAGSDAPAQADATLLGTGYYCIKIRGDQRATLYEWLKNSTWKRRFSFQLDTETGIKQEIIGVTISNNVFQDASGNYQGNLIAFHDWEYIDEGGYSLITLLANIAAQAIKSQSNNYPLYTVPRLTQQPITIQPCRIDIARGCLAKFQVAKHVYVSTGYIIDDYIASDAPLTVDQPIYVYLRGVLPTGTSWDISAYDETGAALATSVALSTVTGKRGQYASKAFTPTANQRFVRVKITLNASSDGFRAPIVFGYEIDRTTSYQLLNPVATVTVPQRNTPPALPKSVISALQISPQETDPGTENATFVVNDFTGALKFLGDVNMLPVAAYTTYDSGGTNKACLFRGYVMEAQRRLRRGALGKVYPNQEFSEYTLNCVGEWARAYETILPKMRAWTDPTNGQPFKVTDVIRFNALTIYPPSMVDIPDDAMRLFTSDGQAYVSEYGTRAVDIMKDLATEYLGAYMLFDESAGTKGMLRLLPQKTAPYNNLAIFEIQHPTTIAGDSIPRLPQWCLAYGTTTSGGQTIQHAYVKAGTYQSHREKAEGNCVSVTGAAVDDNASDKASSSASLLTQTAIKVDSFNFLNLAAGAAGYPDGTSPEFYNRIVPIRICDWKLQTQEAVDWKCRRVFERACYSRLYVSFEAPMLLVTDVLDTKQTTPRRLRYYDAVQLRLNDGTLGQFLVMSCSPTYRKDHVQMARYVLCTQSNINSIGVLPDLRALKFVKALARVFGTELHHSSRYSAANTQAANLASQMWGLPTPTSVPIQDLNPASGTFGQFKYLADYSGLP